MSKDYYTKPNDPDPEVDKVLNWAVFALAFASGALGFVIGVAVGK